MRFINKSKPWNENVHPMFQIDEPDVVRANFLSTDGGVRIVSDFPMKSFAAEVILNYINSGIHDNLEIAVIEGELGINEGSGAGIQYCFGTVQLSVCAASSEASYSLLEPYPVSTEALGDNRLREAVILLETLFTKQPLEFQPDLLGFFGEPEEIEKDFSGWPKESDEI